MELKIAIALIGLLGTITAPILALLVKAKIDSSKKPVAKRERLSALQGNWEGLAHQFVGSVDGEAKVNLLIKVKGKDISGSVNVEFYEPKITVQGELKNGLFDGEALRITYENADPNVIQHGHLQLVLEPDGASLNGGFIGYGFISKQIVLGTLKLNKKI